jgi:acetyl esterase/lipase
MIMALRIFIPPAIFWSTKPMSKFFRPVATRIYAVLLALLAAQVQALETGMPPELALKIAEIGRVIDPGKSAPLYIPLQEKEPYAGTKVLRDARYGPDARNLLDVFSPETAGAPRPVLLFVHGGGFVAGNKRAPGSPFYDNIHLWAVRHGMVGVNITYRLAPAVTWPSGAQDLGQAVEWVMTNISALGGDPKRVYLIGNSAGATHVTDYLSQVALQKFKDQRIAGAVLLSGIYDLTTFDLQAQLKPYFGDDVVRYAERSSLNGVLKSSVPLLVSQAEHDPLPFENQAKQLRDALCKSPRGCQTFVVLAKHNHLSQVQSINTSDTTLTRHLLQFIR